MIFSFKQFQVSQCADVFEIGTDALLLGALSTIYENTKSILEVGCGTGVVSLMIAQQTDADIFSIDINQKAIECAGSNFKNAKFSNKFSTELTCLSTFQREQKFDLIVSNPPFYDSQTLAKKSRDMARNNASHFLLLFFRNAKRLLQEHGKISVIVPINNRLDYVKEALKHEFLLESELLIETGKNNISRVILCFSKMLKESYKSEVFMLRDEFNQYSLAYKELMLPFLI